MKKETILISIAILCAALLFGWGIKWLIEDTNKSNTAFYLKMEEQNKCISKNSEKILTFVKECTASLKVEENAYAIETCEDVARRTLCQ